MFFPVISIWTAAIQAGYINFPGLTLAMVYRYVSNTPVKSKGHLDQFQQGRCITKCLTTGLELESDLHPVPSVNIDSGRLRYINKSVALPGMRNSAKIVYSDSVALKGIEP